MKAEQPAELRVVLDRADGVGGEQLREHPVQEVPVLEDVGDATRAPAVVLEHQVLAVLVPTPRHGAHDVVVIEQEVDARFVAKQRKQLGIVRTVTTYDLDAHALVGIAAGRCGAHEGLGHAAHPEPLLDVVGPDPEYVGSEHGQSLA